MRNDIRAKQKRSIRVKSLFLALLLVLTSAFMTMSLTYADELDDAKKALKNQQNSIKNSQDALKEGKAQSSALAQEIRSLDNKIYASEVEINDLEIEINDLKDQLVVKRDELEAKMNEVSDQNDSLNLRLRTMYKNGEVGTLSVLLGSGSISDFLTNIEMVKRIYNSDANLLTQLQEQYTEIEAAKDELVKMKNDLMIRQDEIEAKKAALAADKETVKAKKAEVDADNKELAAQIDAMNKEANALTARILALQSAKDYIGGSMQWPAPASRYISSPFGNRLHPILKVYKLHTGIDIAAAAGTDIVAANGGTVITAGWNNSYGYFVMIDHGGGIVTLYAHSSKLLVSKDDVVGRGQTIAKVGSTGMSTGPHLHFEVRVNGVYKNPLNYVSP